MIEKKSRNIQTFLPYIRRGLFVLLGFGMVCIFLGIKSYWKYVGIELRAMFDRPAPVTTFATSTVSFTRIQQQIAELPKELSTTSIPYRLVMPSIGVDIPVIVDEPDADKGLSQGAWFLPRTAVPGADADSTLNTVISAHRYRYTSGPKTFYNLDKVKPGDIIILFWNNKRYIYQAVSLEVVRPTEVRILDRTEKPVLTLFTCTPLFTNKERLVVRAELLEVGD